MKRHRPAASGQVRPATAILFWLILAALGIGLSWSVEPFAGLAAIALWVMGIIYNVPPLRVGVFVALMFTHVPVLYDMFNVELSNASPLWTLGSP